MTGLWVTYKTHIESIAHRRLKWTHTEKHCLWQTQSPAKSLQISQINVKGWWWDIARFGMISKWLLSRYYQWAYGLVWLQLPLPQRSKLDATVTGLSICQDGRYEYETQFEVHPTRLVASVTMAAWGERGVIHWMSQSNDWSTTH